MSRPDLEKLLIGAAVALLVLIVAMFVRGGGYGIGGLSWDSYLTIDRANTRLGAFSVAPDDHIRAVHDRPVFRDADLRGVLRGSAGDEVWLEVERADYELAIPLNPEAIEQDDLPAALRGPYQVVAIDDRRIVGDMRLADMAAWMRARDDAPTIFTISVPEYSVQGWVRRVRRPGPILPVVVLVFTLAVAGLSILRARSEVMGRRRRLWHLVGLSSISGGVLLAFLFWHDGFLADPVLLPFALISLCAWRPLSLALHQMPRGSISGRANRFVWLGAALPAAIVLLAGLYGWSRTIPDLFGTALDGFVFDQMRSLVLVAAGLCVLYHAVDVGVHGRFIRAIRGRPKQLNESVPWVAMLLSSFAIVSAIVSASTDPAAFLERGYVVHLGILVGLQWVGDLALLPQPTTTQGIEARPEERLDLVDALLQAQTLLDLDEPELACRLSGADVTLRLVEDEDEQVELEAVPMDERLSGLIELLDSEGGMFPRYKTIRGGAELGDDPFEGMALTVGVSLVLPLVPSDGEDREVGVYLVNRLDDDAEFAPGPPAVEQLGPWMESFRAHHNVWSDVRAHAAEGALAFEPNESEPPAPAPAAPPPVQAPPPRAPDATAPRMAVRPDLEAALRYWSLEAEARYPLADPTVLDQLEPEDLQSFASSRGAMLLLGPVGSGRELRARMIHRLSGLPGAFITLDCGALPPALVPVELAGEDDLPGRLAAADEGTMCIRGLSACPDEVISDALQAVRDHGCRLILIESTDNKGALAEPILRAVDEAIHTVPSLEGDTERIHTGALGLLHDLAMRHGKVVTGFDEQALAWLADQPWPANYLSLRSTVRDAVLKCDGAVISVGLLGAGESIPIDDGAPSLSDTMHDVEKAVLFKALDAAHGNKSEAARSLGMKRTTFLRRLNKYLAEATS